MASAAALNRLCATSALAQTASDYKALVCIFLFGGNDGHNMLVPQDTAGYAAYRAIRKGLALPGNDAKLMPIIARSGGLFAFNDGASGVVLKPFDPRRFVADIVALTTTIPLSEAV